MTDSTPSTHPAGVAAHEATPYVAAKPHGPEVEALRARIPGWGADLDPADRPSYPQEVDAQTGSPWALPPQQQPDGPRERSIEHARLTPVFGETIALRGASGAVRRLAYDRFSEGKIAHWLLLMAGDRLDVAESAARRWRDKLSERRR